MDEYFDGIRFIDRKPSNKRYKHTYLMIHGLGGSLEQWIDVTDELATDARVIVVDVPGFGGSRADDTSFDLTKSIERLAQFVAHKNLHGSILVAHSIGCVVAGRLAAMSPESYARVVLVSGALIRASEIAQVPSRAILHPRIGFYVTIQFLAGATPLPPPLLRVITRSSLLRRALFWPFVAKPEELCPTQLTRLLAKSGSRAVIRILLTASRIDFKRALSSIPHPVESVWGSADPLISQYDVTHLRALARVTREKELAGCGHWPWIEDVPALVSFLRESGDDGTDPDHHY